MKKLLFLLLLLISSFAFSQENPSAVEDGIIVRCSISSGTKNTWNSIYIGSPNIRKNISISIDSTVINRVTKIAFKNSSGFPDTATGYYVLGSSIRQWRNRNSDYLYYKSDTTGAFWINVEYTNGPSLEYGGLSKKEVLNLISSSSSSDTNTYIKKYTPQTKNGDLTIEGNLTNIGLVTDRPVLYQKYSDVGQPQISFVGQVGVGEMNIGLNLDYSQGTHNYYDTSHSITYLTLNEPEGIAWQRIPKGYPNTTMQPDAWSLSGNTYPFWVDTSGFLGVIGGMTSIFKTKGKPKVGTSKVDDYTDTTKYNFYGRGGKNYFQNKIGIGTETPFGTLHIVNPSSTQSTSGYDSRTDVVIEDNSNSDRAALELRSPIGATIAFGDKTTYNLDYIATNHSTNVMDIVATGSYVNISPSIRENGTALTSKYAQLVQLDTLPQLNKTTGQIFAGNIKITGHLPINTSGISPIPWVAVGLSVGDSNMIGLNVVNTTLNTVRSSQTQATDTSSISFGLTQWTGKPQMDFRDNSGTLTFAIDSTGRVFSANYIQAGTDFLTTDTKGYIVGFNSIGTLGVYLNSTADNTLRIRNAGVSTDAIVQLGRLIATNVTPISTSSSTGTQGTLVIGSDGYIYICTATNTWQRILTTTF